MYFKLRSHLSRILFLSLFFCCLNINAENFFSDYVSRSWTVEDGLPGNTITDIVQTDSGYIYLGTYDGLVKFDGLAFEVFSKNSLKNYKCVSARCLFEDSNKNLWIGSNDEGVAKINGDKVVMYTTEQGLPSNSIRAITEDKDGNIWIGTAGGIVFFTPKDEIRIPLGLEEYGEKNLTVTSIYCDEENKIWLSTSRSNGFYCYENDRFKKVNFQELADFSDSKLNPLDFSITSMIQDSNGVYWFGLQNQGIISIKDNKYRFWNKDDGVILATVNCIFEDSKANIWFGTEKGVSLLNNGKFYSYTESEGLSNNNISKILEDREGSIWLATDRGGVERLTIGKFKTFSTDSTVNCIAQDNDSFVWIGTDTGLLCYKDEVQIENKLTRYCNDVRIRDVSIANNGAILVSTYAVHGLVYFYKDTITEYKKEDGLAGLKVRDSLQAKDGTLYVATTTGLSIINLQNKEIKNLTKKDGLSNEYIMCIYQDDKDRVWIGSDGGGISILEDNRIVETLTTDEGLAGNVIFKIHQDKEKNFWICTGSGISFFDGQTIINYDSTNGFFTDSVFQLIIDENNIAWMTTNKGVSSVDLASLKDQSIKKIEVRQYNKNDGLLTLGATSTSVSMKDNKKRIWFPLVDGFAIYDPFKTKQVNVDPIIRIEKVYLDDNEFSFVDNMIIDAGVKRIKIKYTGLSYISPEKIDFSYKLEGYDEKYSLKTKEREVSYTNLRSGDYTFLVFALTSDGVYSHVPASFTFTKKAYYYQTWQFYVLMISLLFFIILIIVIFNVRKIQKEQEKLESLVQSRTADLQVEKNKSQLILQSIFPKPVIERVKLHRENVIADKFEESTILIVEVNNLYENLNDSLDLVILELNQLYSKFDDRITVLGLEKIQTTFNKYMVVCGIPFCNKNHADLIIKCAWGMMQDLEKFNKKSKIKFSLKIGINSGFIYGAILGKTKVGYNVFGTTVDIANMVAEENKTNLVCISEETQKLTIEKVKIMNVEEIDFNDRKIKVFYLETQEVKDFKYERIDSVFDDI